MAIARDRGACPCANGDETTLSWTWSVKSRWHGVDHILL